MKELVRCKSCGFIMEKGKLRGKCPACGVPDKMFEPYTEKIAPFRKFILSLDLHPIMVHYPQAFSMSVFLLSLLAPCTAGGVHDKIVSAIVVLGGVLPITVVLAFCAGVYDGMVRFRRVTTPILKKKITVGALFLFFSCAICGVIVFKPLSTWQALLTVTGLSLAAIACGGYLSKLGTSLLNSKFPG
jgi:hypothetical protein